MAVKKLASLLNATGELKAIAERTRQVRDWQRRYEHAVPPALARATQVAGFRSGTLVVWADNAAVAAKLKQQATRLAAALSNERDTVTAVRVMVQPSAAVRAASEKRRRAGLPLHAVNQFARLSESIPDSPLKEALETLIARHRPRS